MFTNWQKLNCYFYFFEKYLVHHFSAAIEIIVILIGCVLCNVNARLHRDFNHDANRANLRLTLRVRYADKSALNGVYPAFRRRLNRNEYQVIIAKNGSKLPNHSDWPNSI